MGGFKRAQGALKFLKEKGFSNVDLALMDKKRAQVNEVSEM